MQGTCLPPEFLGQATSNKEEARIPYAIHMNIVIADIDAVRAHRIARGDDAEFRLVRTLEEVVTSCFGTREAYVKAYLPIMVGLGLAKEGEPLCVQVSRASERPRFREMNPLVISVRLPRGSFWKVVPRQIEVANAMREADLNLYVHCPALCVVLRAAKKPRASEKVLRRIYPFAKAFALASEFCGKFSNDPDDPTQAAVRYDVAPILSQSSLCAYLRQVSGIDGIAIARKVAEQVADNQGSIREVALYACLILRPGLGGLHLPRPVTNEPLDLSKGDLSLIKHKTLTPDLYWEVYKLVLEYDGLDHFTVEGAREDKRRIHDYQVLGLTVIPVTAEDLQGVDALDKLLRAIVRQMSAVDGDVLCHRIARILRDKSLRNCRSVLLSTILAAE